MDGVGVTLGSFELESTATVVGGCIAVTAYL